MIAIRPAVESDSPAIAAIYAPFVLGGTVSFETEAPDADTMCRRMHAWRGYYPWLVATSGEDGGVLGYAYAGLWRDRPAYRYVVETSIYTAGPLQRQGPARLLYDALIDTLRAQGFTQAIAVLSLPNEGAIQLHESVGFRRTGMYREIGYKQGQWLDIGFWQCALNTSRVPPVEPRPFSEVGVVRD
ncbi:GNAT family N-acetyltransferase [Sphingomonas sp.]|uniref:GNAT family N-acetyltransferase n=1 Tax=Sphingomonas sp. TaxID=28214 RepID=UPI001D213B0C|nr:GNAT family N-acetyltransferase [Sphingomonas sp.]MBX9797263.1 GNAT family N-acetyltransferase [Sphingomonas sp.]